MTVCTGLSWSLPSRLLLRVSTNDTGPSTSSMIATSPGAPTRNVPRIVRGAGIRIGEDIAWAQQVEDVGHQLARLDAADMHHELAVRAGLLASHDGAPERLS